MNFTASKKNKPDETIWVNIFTLVESKTTRSDAADLLNRMIWLLDAIDNYPEFLDNEQLHLIDPIDAVVEDLKGVVVDKINFRSDNEDDKSEESLSDLKKFR